MRRVTKEDRCTFKLFGTDTDRIHMKKVVQTRAAQPSENVGTTTSQIFDGAATRAG